MILSSFNIIRAAATSTSRFHLNIHSLDRQIPVPVEDLKSPLLFALKRVLIGIHLLLQCRLIERLIGHGRILKNDGHTEIPAPIFGGVVARLIPAYLRDPPPL